MWLGATIGGVSSPRDDWSSTHALLPDFATPVEDRWFEDYEAGSVHRYGWLSLTEQEIVDFAHRYDPQPFHTDPVAAAEGPLGTHMASGWQTCALLMRLFADHYLSRCASLTSPGVDELRWTAPVRPGDRLALEVRTIETRRSRTKPDRGLVRSGCELATEGGVVVLTLSAMNILAVRPTD